MTAGRPRSLQPQNMNHLITLPSVLLGLVAMASISLAAPSARDQLWPSGALDARGVQLEDMPTLS